jgi:hypothetical protein
MMKDCTECFMSVLWKLMFLFMVHLMTLPAAQAVVSNGDNIRNTNWKG